MGSVACGAVDLSWLLTLGFLTCSGVWPERMGQVPVEAGGAKAALMAEKSTGLSLVAFLVAEILARNVLIRAVASSATSSSECLSAGWKKHKKTSVGPLEAWARVVKNSGGVSVELCVLTFAAERNSKQKSLGRHILSETWQGSCCARCAPLPRCACPCG
eukprot:9478850-Pyramimonas_sp.AAC.1